MVLKINVKITLIILFDATEFLIILYELMNHLKKRYKCLENCVLININLCGKLFSLLESPATFNEIFQVISLPLFIPYFNLSSS